MMSVTNLKTGTVFKDNGEPWLVLKYTHTKIARGGATIRVKCRNLKTGAVTEKTFRSGSSVEEADIIRRKAQFLYLDSSAAHFMDPQSFEQFSVTLEVAGDAKDFLKEGLEIYVLEYEDSPISLELPISVEYKVVETEPGEKGNTVSNVLKPAKIETGATIQVPTFVKVGDRIRVDTRDGRYVERA